MHREMTYVAEMWDWHRQHARKARSYGDVMEVDATLQHARRNMKRMPKYTGLSPPEEAQSWPLLPSIRNGSRDHWQQRVGQTYAQVCVAGLK